MSYKTNIFRTRNLISDLGIEVYGYRVLNLGRDQDKFKVLGRLSREIAPKLNAPSTTYSPSEEEDYVLIFNPVNPPKEIKMDGFILRLEIEGEGLGKYPSPAKRLLYSLTRQKLEYHGLWRDVYNKYFSFSHDKIVKGKYGEYRVYRGVFYRYEIMDGYAWLVLDSITRVVQNDSVQVLLSKLGVEKVKAMFKEGRYIITSQVRGIIPTFSVRKVLRLRDDLRAGRDEVIEKDGRWYTVKSWYLDYRDLPEIANKISDDEPLLETEGGLYYAPSMAHLVLRTKDIEGESKYLKDEIYLTADRRFGQIERFLNVINPLHVPKFPNIPKIEFLEEPSTFESRYLEPPDLRFRRGKIFNLKDEGGFEKYTSFFKNKLKEHGPAKAKVRFSARERLALVYPREHLAEEQVKKFYLDLRKVGRKYLRIKLPPKNKLYLWDYSGDDTTEVRKNYSKFKGNVKAIICILGSDDPLYFEFKKMFQDVPCQMVLRTLVLSKYDLPGDKMHLYFNSVLNLVCGLLGKMGARPWLLGEKLKGDLYIGVDTRPSKVVTFTLIDSIGNYIGEARMPIEGSKVEEGVMRDAVTQLIMENLRALPKGRPIHLVMHRDGDVYVSEEQGLEEAVSSLKRRNLEVSATLVSVRETTPYRIFKYNSGNLMPCPPGVFVKLSEHMGLLASVGWPLIKQGLARPLLIEVIKNDKPDYTLQEVVKEVYYLSFLHWEGIIKKLKLPITIKYADEYAVFAERGIDIIGPPL